MEFRLNIKEKIAEMELEIKQQRSRIEVLERALDNHDHDDDVFDILESWLTKIGENRK